MEETVVIRGFSRQAKMAGLPLPYAMAVVALWMIPFMIVKWLPILLTLPIWYFGARSITAVNPHGHRIFLARLRFVPMSFWQASVKFARSTKGLLKDV